MVLEATQEPAWFHKVGVTDEGGVMLFHEMPGRLLKQVANQSNVAFISATLSIADNCHARTYRDRCKNRAYGSYKTVERCT